LLKKKKISSADKALSHTRGLKKEKGFLVKARNEAKS